MKNIRRKKLRKYKALNSKKILFLLMLICFVSIGFSLPQSILSYKGTVNVKKKIYDAEEVEYTLLNINNSKQAIEDLHRINELKINNKEQIEEPSSFAEDSWNTISYAVQSNNIPYELGDTKCIELNGFTTTNSNGCSNGEFSVKIVNINECVNGETSETACGFVIEFSDIIGLVAMNSTATNVGGWASSAMRTYVNETIYGALPSDLQNVIIETKAISGANSIANNYETYDKLYLLDPYELWGKYSKLKTYVTTYYTTKQLDYYRENEVTMTENVNLIRKKYNTAGKPYYLRTAMKSNNTQFTRVYQNGLVTDSSGVTIYIGINANTAQGVAPAFRIG